MSKRIIRDVPLGDDFFVLANRGEALLWLGIAVVFAVAGARNQSRRCIHALAAVAFALFGVSDLIEAHTGAWWSAVVAARMERCLRRAYRVGRPANPAS